MEKTEIVYIKGDATAPVGDGQKLIIHVCNNVGAWGAGFVMALSKKWKEPEEQYRTKKSYDLGTYELVRVEDDITVCNLIAQENIRSNINTLPPVRYVAIETGLKELSKYLSMYDQHKHSISIHMPMIGSGLAGGNWLIIERIIELTLCDAGIPVTVYQFD